MCGRYLASKRICFVFRYFHGFALKIVQMPIATERHLNHSWLEIFHSINARYVTSCITVAEKIIGIYVSTCHRNLYMEREQTLRRSTQGVMQNRVQGEPDELIALITSVTREPIALLISSNNFLPKCLLIILQVAFNLRCRV